MRLPFATIALLIWAIAATGAWRAARGQAESKNIKDNSFLIEEAYNQEAGVAQHIFTWYPTWFHDDGDNQEFAFNYVIELPIGSETHQFSFTPLVFEQFNNHPDVGPPEEEGGWGDTLVNYRYQLSFEDVDGWRPAISPRFSLLLPTGDEDRGLGTGELGYQFNLPVSKEIDPFAFHFNAGLTYTPHVSTLLVNNNETFQRDLNGYNLGGSAIWLAGYDVNFMLELVSFWDEEPDELGNVDRTTSVILDPGVRCALFTGEEVQWVVGLGLPIGLSDDAPDFGVFIYMSVEHSFLPGA